MITSSQSRCLKGLTGNLMNVARTVVIIRFDISNQQSTEGKQEIYKKHINAKDNIKTYI